MMQVELVEVADLPQPVTIGHDQGPPRKLDQAFPTQGLERSVPMDRRQSRRVGKLLVGQREFEHAILVHANLFETDRQFTQEVSSRMAFR